MNIKFTFACFLFIFCCEKLTTQNMQSGSVIDKVRREAVGSAYVQNHSQKRTVVSSVRGIFQLPALPGDTLIISCVGYKTRQFIPDNPQNSLVIELIQDVKTLDEVTVRGWSESRFKREFLSVAIPEKTKVDIVLPPMGVQLGNAGRMGYDYATLAPKMTLKGPISIIYDKFSRESKNKRSIQKLQIVELKKQKYQQRMDTLWISRVTDLKGERLGSFMKFCQLSEDFVLSAYEYELTVAIRVCLKDFLAMN